MPASYAAHFQYQNVAAVQGARSPSKTTPGISLDIENHIYEISGHAIGSMKPLTQAINHMRSYGDRIATSSGNGPQAYVPIILEDALSTHCQLTGELCGVISNYYDKINVHLSARHMTVHELSQFIKNAVSKDKLILTTEV